MPAAPTREQLDVAQALVQSAADALTAQLRAKGYEKAHAEIWIGRGNISGPGTTCHIFIENAYGLGFIRPSEHLSHAVAMAEKAIAAAPEQYTTASMAPWFEGTRP